MWSAVNATQWYHVDRPTQWEHDENLIFSSRYNFWAPCEKVISDYQRIFYNSGNNVLGGGVYTRPSWNSMAANDAIAGARAVVAASLYDGMSWGGMPPRETALAITSEILYGWQPDQVDTIMHHIECEMRQRGI